MARAGAQRGQQDQPAYKLDAITRELPIRFELRDKTWAVSADPDVEVIATMLDLEEKLTTIGDLKQVDDEGGKTLAEYIVDAKELVLDLIEDWGDQAQPLDRQAFRISTTELLSLFGLITGSPTVADAVAEAITAGASAAKMADEFDPGEDDPGRAEDAAGAPLRSRRRSSRRSSS